MKHKTDIRKSKVQGSTEGRRSRGVALGQGQRFGADLLAQIRKRFCHVQSDPLRGRRVYLESAGGALRLRRVVDVAAKLTMLPDNAGRRNVTSAEVDRALAQGVADVRLIMGARTGAITVGESTTGNAFRIINTLVREIPGRNVVTTNLDHPAIFDSTKLVSQRYGKEWRVAELSPHTGRVEPAAVVKHINAETALLALIHSSNITGMRNDVPAIVRAARAVKPDLVVMVDGAQHGSHGVVDVEQLGCDVYLISSYKLFSKIGASAAYLSERVSRLAHDRLLGKAEDQWDLGTRDQAGYAGWSVVVEYLSWLGRQFTDSPDRRQQILAAMTAIEGHERTLTQAVLYGSQEASGLPGATPGLLQMPHVTVYGETRDLSAREPCVIFSVAGMTSAAVVAGLEQASIRVCNRVSDAYSRHTLQALNISECVRVSMGHYNTPAEVAVFLRTIARMKS
jgi:cysteine desulfurase / selenocysteine lyase